MNHFEKKKIVNKIRIDMKRWKAKFAPEMSLSRACFYWAVMTHVTLKEIGFKSLMSAGSLSWPRVRPQDDNGEVDTHFSYTWDPTSPASIAQVATGGIPEMHVWVQLPETMEIVDLTTCYLKQQCRTLTGAKWTATDPPDFLWARVDSLPSGVHYDPHMDAVRLVRCLIQKTWGI